ncbi:MAG: hypothetical protein IJ801_01815 [Lachnospiraceae bacterium]|nr:hypothetical protein [Lachnospiraceae bacterium]
MPCVTEQTEEEQSDETIRENTKESQKGIGIQIGKQTKITKYLSGKFIKKEGIRYFKKKDGSLARNCFFTNKKDVYHVNSKGVVSTGWKKLKGHYYFFDRKTGRLRRNTEADNIRILKTGIAKETRLNLSRIEVYMEAQKIVNTVSKPSDSKAAKLLKCYKWMKPFPYKQFRTMRTAKSRHPEDWDIVFANDIFKEHRGCCASEACAFAYLAKVCGYEKVTICSDTGHAWVDIDGRLYDPLFAEARSFSKNYNAAYTDYRKHPAYTKKL